MSRVFLQNCPDILADICGRIKLNLFVEGARWVRKGRKEKPNCHEFFMHESRAKKALIIV